MARRLRVGPGGGDSPFDMSRFIGGGGAGGKGISKVREKFMKKFRDTFNRTKVEKAAKQKKRGKFKALAKEIPEKTTRTEFDEVAAQTRRVLGVRRRSRIRAPKVSERNRQARRMEELAPSERAAGRSASADANRKLNSKNLRRAQEIADRNFKKLREIRNRKRGK